MVAFIQAVRFFANFDRDIINNNGTISNNEIISNNLICVDSYLKQIKKIIYFYNDLFHKFSNDLFHKFSNIFVYIDIIVFVEACI
jgi:hypothetical protein